MLTFLAVCLLYVAVFAFHQAGERRTVFAGLKSSPTKRSAVRWFGWGLAVIALIVLAQPQGLERGIPIWLAAFMLAAFACLLTGSLLPDFHRKSAILASILCLGLGFGVLAGGWS
ncbi:MAG: DUF3325 family protein [Pseudomonadota bacterium]